MNTPPGETDLIFAAARRAALHVFAFMRIIEPQRQADSLARAPVARNFGSGVLVQTKGRFAVITADHVRAELLGHPGIFIPASLSGKCGLRLDSERIRWVLEGKSPYTPQGPDIAVGTFSVADAISLESVGYSFYNLDRHYGDAAEFASSGATDGYAVFGGLGERTDREAQVIGGHAHQSIGGICTGGPASKYEVRDGMDYVNVTIDHSEPGDPESFAGLSGSALWRIRAAREARRELDSLILSGIVFHQSDSEDGQRTLFCHGYRSIYEACRQRIAIN